MYEVLIGVLFAAGSISSYLLAAKIVGHERARRRRARCVGHQRALTTKDLSRHFDAR